MPTTDESYYVEFYRLGNAVKVSAIDPATGTEATIVAPLTASEHYLKRAAVNKLRYVLAKKNGMPGDDTHNPDSSDGGIVV